MISSANQFEDEIDLREILRVILAKWHWIAAATVLSSAVALGVSLLLPKQYQASAYVALTKPDVVFRFDPRITTQVEAPGGRGVQSLALGDEVLREVLEDTAAATLDPEELFVDTFRERVDAALTDTVLKLSLEDNDPERAASLTNAWAKSVVRLLNAIYAPTSGALDLFESQAEEALAGWEAAQQALIDFQSTNKERILRQRLVARERVLASYLEAHRMLGLVLLDAQALQVRLAVRGSAPSDLRDDLTMLLLATRSLVSTVSSPPSIVEPSVEGGIVILPDTIVSPLDLQIQLQGDLLFGESAEEQVNFLEALIESLEDQRVALEEEAATLQFGIYELQAQLAQAEEDRIRLEQERDLSREAYQTLARKAQETKLVAQDQENIALIASRAIVPSQPKGPRIKLNTVIAGIAGLMVGICWTLIYKWWRRDLVIHDPT